jgi:DNA-directed RNA polymerase sigma subunit (sigma70/sigma32)
MNRRHKSFNDPTSRRLVSAEGAELILSALEILTSLEATVITARWGLKDGQYKTLDEIGREFGVTRERIRQIEKRALKKLGEPSSPLAIVDGSAVIDFVEARLTRFPDHSTFAFLVIRL